MSTKTITPLRLGILSCANIAKQFVRDVLGSPAVNIDAVASREFTKAKEFANQFGIARTMRSYEAMVEDTQIDAIYIPLPNSMHAEWAIKALQAGKHVLCEKPLALSLAEARSMFNAARTNEVMLLESYPYWFQPQTADLMNYLSATDGTGIGQVRSIQVSFGYTVTNPETNIRMKPELGGGALLDAGSYALSLIRLVMESAPKEVIAHANWSISGVDMSMMASLLYADGRRAQMSCAMDGANHRRATIVGSHGIIETEFLNHTSPTKNHKWGYLPSQMRIRKGIPNTIAYEEIKSPTGSGFKFAIEAFTKVVQNKDTKSITQSTAASIDIAATLEAIKKSAITGKMTKVG